MANGTNQLLWLRFFLVEEGTDTGSVLTGIHQGG